MNEKFENYIAEIVDRAEKMARDYELAIKKGKFEKECPYPKIIKLYEDIGFKLNEHGWNEQAVIFNSQIQFYYKKLEKDKKLRKIEAQKEQKQKIFKEIHKIKEIDTIRAVIDSLNKEQEILNFEEKKKEKIEESEEIFDIISNAEKIAREYDQKIKSGSIIHLDCPYEKIIGIYRKAKQRFESIGWKEESSKLIASIKYYKEKLEKDKKLREIEDKKFIKEL